MSVEADKVWRTYRIVGTLLAADAFDTLESFRAFTVRSTRTVRQSTRAAVSIGAYKSKRALSIAATWLQAEAADAFEARRAVSTITTGGDADAVVAGKSTGAGVFLITDDLRYADAVDADSARRAVTGLGALQETDISAVVSRGTDVSRRAGIDIVRITYLDACTIEAFVSFWAGIILITLGEWIACTIPAGVAVRTREVIVTSNQANTQSAF